MMTNKHDFKLRIAVASILKKVIDGKLSASEAIKDWPDEDNDNLINIAFHQLGHFDVDEDIRNSDCKYKEWQILEIKKIINELLK